MLVGFGFIYFTNNEIRNHKQPKKKSLCRTRIFVWIFVHQFRFAVKRGKSDDHSPDFVVVCTPLELIFWCGVLSSLFKAELQANSYMRRWNTHMWTVMPAKIFANLSASHQQVTKESLADSMGKRVTTLICTAAQQFMLVTYRQPAWLVNEAALSHWWGYHFALSPCQ